MIIDIDKWQEIFGTLSRNKLRTFLTIFGVFWGIFMLIVMMGAGNGLFNAVTGEWGNMATNSFFMWTKTTTVSYKGFPQGRNYNFTNEDTKALIENIPEIKYIAPRIQGWNGRGGNNVTRGIKTAAYNIKGEYPDFNRIEPIEINNGRFINELDIKEERKVAIIGTRVREVLFGKDENPIGEYIRIQGVYFQVVGTFMPNSSFGDRQESSETIFIPFTTCQKTYNYGNIVGWYAITAKDNIPASVLEKKVISIIKQRHSISPTDDRAVGHWNMEKEFNRMKGLFSGIRILVWIVGCGTLIAGIIGISNIMLIIVKERTKEIGIRRAIGAKPRNIIFQIINEAVFMTTVAGNIGIVVGVGIVELVAYLLEVNDAESDVFTNPEVDFSLAVSALIILIVFGTLAGIIPARKAVSIKPIEAIRNE